MILNMCCPEIDEQTINKSDKNNIIILQPSKIIKHTKYNQICIPGPFPKCICNLTF